MIPRWSTHLVIVWGSIMKPVPPLEKTWQKWCWMMLGGRFRRNGSRNLSPKEGLILQYPIHTCFAPSFFQKNSSCWLQSGIHHPTIPRSSQLPLHPSPGLRVAKSAEDPGAFGSAAPNRSQPWHVLGLGPMWWWFLKMRDPQNHRF